MERKAVILNAGKGRRMDKIGKQTPKCLIPIFDKPILFHQIDMLVEIGIKDITVITGYKSENILAKIWKTPQYSFLECLFNPFYRYTDNIISLWLYLRINQNNRNGLIILSGDRMLCPIIYQSLEKANEFIVVTIGPKEYPVVLKDNIKIKQDRVVSIGAKSSYLSAGILYVPGKERIDLLNSIERVLCRKEGLQKWYLEGIKEMLNNGKRVKALIFPSDFCLNINRVSDLNDLQIKKILERRVFND